MSYQWDREFQLDQAFKPGPPTKSLKDRFIASLDSQIRLTELFLPPKEPGKSGKRDKHWFSEVGENKWHLNIYVANYKLTERPILLNSLHAVKTALEKVRADTEAGRLNEELEKIAAAAKAAGLKRRDALAAAKVQQAQAA
jgi:hypothetical protein